MADKQENAPEFPRAFYVQFSDYYDPGFIYF
jgi:hypothetical protein